MKARLLLLPLVFLALPISPCRATVVTFDDLSETGSGSFIANGYQGLNWSNFLARNGVLSPRISPFLTNGYYYGVVSVSNVVDNYAADPAEINSIGTNFNFLSVYLTGSYNSNLNIEVQGFRSGTMVYDQTVAAGATNSTLFTFNYLNIDRLYFSASGGQPAFGTVPIEQFVMDNFTFEFVPEPSTVVLVGISVLLLSPLLKRKRV